MAQLVTDASGRSAAVLTFLIADVRGYTRFTRERGDAAAASLAKRFANLALDAVEARGGRVIELRGDEALAVFESPVQAVRAAVEFQATCTEESEADPASHSTNHSTAHHSECYAALPSAGRVPHLEQLTTTARSEVCAHGTGFACRIVVWPGSGKGYRTVAE